MCENGLYFYYWSDVMLLHVVCHLRPMQLFSVKYLDAVKEFGLTSAGNFFQMCLLFAGLNALPGGVKFPDSAGAFHYEDSGKLLSVTSNRFIHW